MTTERREEIKRFLTKNPDADNKLVVDHMMEKFEGTKRHQHRAMIQRVRKKLNGTLELNIPKTGRTSSKQENLSNLPKKGMVEMLADVTAKKRQGIEQHARVEELAKLTVKDLRSMCMEMGLSVGGTKVELVGKIFEAEGKQNIDPLPETGKGSTVVFDPEGAVDKKLEELKDADIDVAAAPPKKTATKKLKRTKTGKALKPQKRGRKPGNWPDIEHAETIQRRAFVIDIMLANPKAKRKDLVDEVAQKFPKPSREATEAMIKAAGIALTRHKAKPGEDADERAIINTRLVRFYDLATCPVCKKTAQYEDEIQKLFGYRQDYDRRQSNCRSCRKLKLKNAKK